MMVCNGHVTNQLGGIYIHNSDNLIDWTDEGILVWSDTDSVKKPYPTLIGDTGSSTRTSEDNMLYYQRDYIDGDSRVRMDLYRQTLTFEK